MWGTLGRVPGYGGGLVSGTQCYYSCALEASVPPPWGLDSPRPVLPQPLPTYTVAREAFEKTAWNVSLPCVVPWVKPENHPRLQGPAQSPLLLLSQHLCHGCCSNCLELTDGVTAHPKCHLSSGLLHRPLPLSSTPSPSFPPSSAG